MTNGTGWKEKFLDENGRSGPNDSADKEQLFFDEISRQIRDVVRHFTPDNDGRPLRGNHAKILAGVVGAEFRVSPQIPADFAVGFLSEPGKVYRAHVRFSNASGEFKKDDAMPDLRGAAVRVFTEHGDHDFLMTNAEPHHARDAREAMATIMAGTKMDTVGDALGAFSGQGAFFFHLLSELDWETAKRISDTLGAQTAREVESLAAETYWSRAPIAIGTTTTPEQAVAVKYRLEPAGGGRGPVFPGDGPGLLQRLKERFAGRGDESEPLDLGRELKERIGRGEVRFLFQVQRFVDLATTPIEDATVHWPSEFETIAELVIPQNAEVNDGLVDGHVFSPWKVNGQNFRPLGSMNRSRKKVYEAGADERLNGPRN